jgi:hypothetical protein
VFTHKTEKLVRSDGACLESELLGIGGLQFETSLDKKVSKILSKNKRALWYTAIKLAVILATQESEEDLGPRLTLSKSLPINKIKIRKG